MPYRYEVQVGGDPKFYSNALVFATAEEAERAGHAKAMTWLAVRDYRVTPTTDEPTYTCSPAGTVTPIDPWIEGRWR